jgi:hypothetical protein
VTHPLPPRRPSRISPARALLLPLLLLLTAFVSLTIPVRVQAEGATLTEITGDELPKAFQPGKRYTLRLLYTDPSGDTIRKSDAVLIDESPSGRVSTPAANVSAGDTAKGVPIEWDVNGFEQGSHRARFQVKALTGVVTYPADANGPPYEFVVESLLTKYGILAGGVLVCFLFIPFVTYFLFRMVNQRGDPSRAARVALLFGILAVCILFITLFSSVYGVLTYAILVLGLLGAVVLLFGGRR